MISPSLTLRTITSRAIRVVSTRGVATRSTVGGLGGVGVPPVSRAVQEIHDIYQQLRQARDRNAMARSECQGCSRDVLHRNCTSQTQPRNTMMSPESNLWTTEDPTNVNSPFHSSFPSPRLHGV